MTIIDSLFIECIYNIPIKKQRFDKYLPNIYFGIFKIFAKYINIKMHIIEKHIILNIYLIFIKYLFSIH